MAAIATTVIPASSGERTKRRHLRRASQAWDRIAKAASPWLTAFGVLTLATAMLATMSLTKFNRQETVFLGGVLVASALALLSQAANARWMLARRTAQLVTIRAKLSSESSARARAERSLEKLRERDRLVDEWLPAMVAYVGIDGRLRYHNRAFAHWLRLSDSAIDGHCVEEVLGHAAFLQAEPRLQEAFRGEDVRYERVQTMRDGAVCHLLVQYFPRYLASGEVEGVFALLSDITEARDVAPAEPCAARGDPAARLRSALDDDEFTLHIQAIAPLGGAPGGPPMGEVLLRMDEEEEKLLPPGGFFPLAGELGLLHELDRWVVRHVVDLVAVQRAPASIFMVNLWPETVLEEAFPAFVRERLEERGIAGESLCFELAEHDLLAHRDAYRAFMERLGACGCRFAVCGVADACSLGTLRGLPVDYVKLDPGLVLGMLRDAERLAHVKAVVQASRDVGLRTIAECVESEPARLALARIGVSFAQGFGIASPQPIRS